MSQTMSADLTALFKQEGVEEAIRTHFEKESILKTSYFANLTSEDRCKEDLKNEWLANVPEFKDSRGQLARLIQVWRLCDAANKRSLTRAADGMAAEELDEPICPQVSQSLHANFTDYYHWELRVDSYGSDTLTGRIRREAERNQPSMFPVSRVRSLVEAQRGANSAKKRRVADGVSIEVEGDHDECGPVDHMSDYDRYKRNLRILANSWALIGNYDVDYENRKVRYASWQQTTEYIDEISKRADELRHLCGEARALETTTTIEEHIRAAAIELTRSKATVPWGAALGLACVQERWRWSEARSLAQRTRPATNPLSSQSQQQPQRADKGKGKGKNKGASGQQSPATFKHKMGPTAKEDHNGKGLCKPWNDKRGCVTPCPHGKKHACDVVLGRNGQACGSTAHNRQGHVESVHGKAAGW